MNFAERKERGKKNIELKLLGLLCMMRCDARTRNEREIRGN